MIDSEQSNRDGNESRDGACRLSDNRKKVFELKNCVSNSDINQYIYLDIKLNLQFISKQEEYKKINL